MAKKPLTDNQKIIRNDILRYKKNKLASSLALLGLVFNCLYFMLLYSFNNTYFYNIEIGLSVILTLVILLTVFLSSEGVKGYNKAYSYVLVVIAAIQVVRIFTTPMMAAIGKPLFVSKESLVSPNTVLSGHYFGMTLTNALSSTILIVYLIASAACLVASAVFGYIYAQRLHSFEKKLAAGEINIDATLKAMDAEDEAKVAAQADVQPAKEEVQ